MIAVLSPAKTLDMRTVDIPHSQPRYLADSGKLIETLRQKSVAELGKLMSISDKLAALNHDRFRSFAEPFTPENATPALLAFRGDVYRDLAAETFRPEQFNFANDHLRILSGLYGVLRPRDLMQPYRLEMGTRLANARGKNLYEFWGDRITDLLNEDLASTGSDLLLNLASQEYFKSIKKDRIDGRILTIHFKERREDKLRVVAFNAKRARGRMANLIVRERITTAAPLQELVVNDYVYDEGLSTGEDWVWVK